MALSEDVSNMIMPVAPLQNGGYGNAGFGGDFSSWLILFIIFALFGNGGWGNNAGMNSGLATDFPWLMNANNNTDSLIAAGFANQATNTAINGIQSAVTTGFGDVQTSLCGGFAGVNATVNGAQNAIAQQLYAGQISDLERSFAAQTANTQGMMNLQSQLAQCCCDNRLATAQTQALVQSENCSDRAALSEGIRDIITSQTAGVQRILDQMCNDKIDAKNERIAELQNQLTMANLAASQTAQTAQLLADNNKQTTLLEQYLNPAPIPAYVVANPNGCNCNAYGCGMA